MKRAVHIHKIVLVVIGDFLDRCEKVMLVAK
jgi:hypothetical protein